jgi:hypothetical protein
MDSEQQSTERIFLSYEGMLDEQTITFIFQLAEEKLKHIDKLNKKKFYYLFVESVQNIYRHQANPAGGKALIQVLHEGNEYKIITGNYIHASGVERLKKFIEEINTLNAEQLQQLYLNKLSTNEISASGGAGLGLIDIARKSGNKINYTIFEKTAEFSYLRLQVNIN